VGGPCRRAGQAAGEDVAEADRLQRVGVDVAVGQRHHRVDGGQRAQPVQERPGDLGALPGGVVGADRVRALGHDAELLDQRRVDRQRHRQSGGLLAGRLGARQPLEDGQRAVEPASGGHRAGQLVVGEAAEG
jgi:hypothetical protein